jgi:tetratricopeptide (TPR) repeat protein
VARDPGGYNGFTDRAVDVRVDDGPDPIAEIARLTRLALVNDTWNRGWTAYTGGRYADALRWQRQVVAMATERAPALLPEVLYDLAIILQANGATDEAVATLSHAFALNPHLREQALQDKDLAGLRSRIPTAP